MSAPERNVTVVLPFVVTMQELARVAGDERTPNMSVRVDPLISDIVGTMMSACVQSGIMVQRHRDGLGFDAESATELAIVLACSKGVQP